MRVLTQCSGDVPRMMGCWLWVDIVTSSGLRPSASYESTADEARFSRAAAANEGSRDLYLA